ncbi:MAG: two-component system sensor histidine kinase CreC, partial [Vibrio sp.]
MSWLQRIVTQARRMKLSFMMRLFFFFFVLIGIGLVLQMTIFMQEFKPGLRQGSEEALVDSANLLAELVAPQLSQVSTNAHASELNLPPELFTHLSQAVTRFQQRNVSAQIWSKDKQASDILVYITDAKGKVLFHSNSSEVGKDYSRWNDVYKTLRGEYGARSTEDEVGNPLSSRMYVAAPIMQQENIIGVLTLGKANASFQPFILQAQSKAMRDGAIVILVALGLGLFVSYWLSRSIKKLNRYAQKVSDGEDAPVPEFIDTELTGLALSMAKMRHQLEGKNYVEEYVHSLTHEMKSPIAAIKGASELLEMPMDKQDRVRFIHNIQSQSSRLEDLVNQLLALAELENKTQLTGKKSIDVETLFYRVKDDFSVALKQNQVSIEVSCLKGAKLRGEPFLMIQALSNLLSNAIAFSLPQQAQASSPQGMAKNTIWLSCYRYGAYLYLQVDDCGVGIPEFAQDKLFERFYSLPRPQSGKKSSGLGLSFVRQIANLHQGRCEIKNRSQLIDDPSYQAPQGCER